MKVKAVERIYLADLDNTFLIQSFMLLKGIKNLNNIKNKFKTAE
jgi:hypothetical protein